MKRIALVFLMTTLSFWGIGCNSSGSSTSEAASQKNAAAESHKDEVTLPTSEQETVKLRTEPVALEDTPELVRLAGRITLADNRNWHVGVRTEGAVVQVNAGLGDRVKKGEVLAYYHADQVHELRAQYRTASANLKRAQAAEALAQRNYDRMQTLLKLKAASAMQVDQAKQDLVAAQSESQSAEGEVERARELLESDLHVAAEPPLGSKSATADEIPIIAPANGYVIEKNVTPGKSVTPSGGDAFVIGDLSEVWMLASARPEQLSQLKVGQAASVSVTGLPGKQFDGKITNLGQEFDPTTRVVQARIVLNNPSNSLRPEMLANAEISVDSHKPAMLVASDAIQQINGQDAVFVRTAPDRFAVRAVRIGTTMNGKTPILDGLKPGEQIVVAGSFILKSQLLRSSMEND